MLSLALRWLDHHQPGKRRTHRELHMDIQAAPSAPSLHIGEPVCVGVCLVAAYVAKLGENKTALYSPHRPVAHPSAGNIAGDMAVEAVPEPALKKQKRSSTPPPDPDAGAEGHVDADAGPAPELNLPRYISTTPPPPTAPARNALETQQLHVLSAAASVKGDEPSAPSSTPPPPAHLEDTMPMKTEPTDAAVLLLAGLAQLAAVANKQASFPGDAHTAIAMHQRSTTPEPMVRVRPRLLAYNDIEAAKALASAPLRPPKVYQRKSSPEPLYTKFLHLANKKPKPPPPPQHSTGGSRHGMKQCKCGSPWI